MTRKHKIGLSPGSLVYTGKSKMLDPVLQGLKYNHEELIPINKDRCLHTTLENGYQYWFDLKGIHDVSIIAQIGERFNIHKLIQEDILDPGQRVKIEDYDSAMFAIVNNLSYDKLKKELYKEQIAIYYTKQYLISFQEDPDDTFAPIRDRMKMQVSRTRSRGTDYLFYALIDYIVDKYYLILEDLNDELEDMEGRMGESNFTIDYEDLHLLRNNLITFKRFVYPLREEISQIKNLETNLINDSSLVFLRDLQDNIHHIIETLDNQREMLNGMRELVLSRTNLNMNKDMKWLAVVSTVSIPLLFFTGVYGMNFENMPELKWKYGYLYWWITTTIVVLGMVAFLKRKKMF